MIRLPGYSVLEKFHDGSSTQLYRGVREHDQLPVVIKVPRGEYPSSREIARLQHEYRLLSELEIPGVARAYAMEKFGRGQALVMQHLSGQPLNLVMRSRQLTVSESLSVAISLCRTLEALHDRRLVHKDIKPQNILFDTQTGAVHLVDLGIAARIAPEDLGSTEGESLEGTLAYLSPEQTGRISRVVDARSDLYSLGVTLFEMLTGVLPFQNVEPLELLHSHIARTPPRPSSMRPELPEVLSQIVLKLLAKMAEERYQSAAGLRVDLEHCLQKWHESQQIPSFPLAEHDRVTELRLPQRLFGRHAERTQLLTALSRVRGGALELMLLTGPLGIGKTALASELYQPAAQRGDYLLRLRFEEPLRGVPYEPILRAMRGLLRQILAEPPQIVAERKRRLLAALEGNGQILIGLLPELELIIGAQPEVAELHSREAQNRFQLLFQRFLSVFASSTQALVMIAEDLQYADSASLNLLKQLLIDPYGHHLLIVGTYRASEVDAAHSLTLLLDALRSDRVVVNTIGLGSIDAVAIGQLLAEALHVPAAELAELAAAVRAKTGGNPFFIHQFLKVLFRQQLLSYREASGRWQWSTPDILALAATDNVSDLLIDFLRGMPEASQEVIKTAACIGSQFDLKMLIEICSQPAATCVAAVAAAVRAGLLAPLNSDYRFLETAGVVQGDAAVSESPSAGAAHFNLELTLKFLHERLRQTASAQLPDETRQELHLRIGRLRLESCQDGKDAGALFEAVSHLNRGLPRLRALGDAAGLLELARLNLSAGQRAKATVAFEAAAAFFAAGVAALQDVAANNTGPAAAEQEDLAFTLRIEHAHCLQLCGQLSESEDLFRVVLETTKNQRQRALVHLRWCELLSTRGEFFAGLRMGLAGLACVGQELPAPDSDLRAALAQETAETERLLDGRSPSILVEIPLNQSEDAALATQILVALFLPAYMVAPEIYPIIVMRPINIALRHGLCEETSYACAAYGFLLSTIFGKTLEGAEFARVAEALNERRYSASMACRVAVAVGSAGHLYRPLRELVAYMREARAPGLASGDFSYRSLLESNLCQFSPLLSEDLGESLAEIDSGLVLMQRTRESMTTNQLILERQWLRALLGRTASPTTFQDADYDEAEELTKLQKGGVDFLCLQAAWLKLQLLYLFGEYEQACALVHKSESWLDSAPGQVLGCDIVFWYALCLIARLPEVEGEQRAEYEAKIEKYHQELRGRTVHGAANYLHRERLIAAERARLVGHIAEAGLLYDEAIAAAHKAGFVLHEALAHELTGRFYAAAGRNKLASFFLTEVFYAYMRLGMNPKATQLLERYPELLRAETRALQDITRIERPMRVTTSSTSSHSTGDDHLDVNAVLRATEVISRELAIDKVIAQVLMAVMSSAGAQRGFLILERNGALQLEAARDIAADSARLHLGIPIERIGQSSPVENELALSVLHYAMRSREVVALNDIIADPRFSNDPYVSRHKPKAVLCLPLLHQGRLTGILYLENNLATLTFTPARIDLLRILAAQAATALENAMLLHHVQEATEKLRRTNEFLEMQVTQRTEELQRGNGELAAANQRLLVELTERAKAERERALMQEQMLQAQRERLSELSTPIIPITDRILIMPLIGTMDRERAAQLLEVALSGAQQRGAKVVILDITGLRHMDTDIAGFLIKTAQALRLIGAQAILTGIRAEVAHTLVSLGIDLASIESRSNLQNGIAAALKRVSALERRQSFGE